MGLTWYYVWTRLVEQKLECRNYLAIYSLLPGFREQKQKVIFKFWNSPVSRKLNVLEFPLPVSVVSRLGGDSEVSSQCSVIVSGSGPSIFLWMCSWLVRVLAGWARRWWGYCPVATSNQLSHEFHCSMYCIRKDMGYWK